MLGIIVVIKTIPITIILNEKNPHRFMVNRGFYFFYNSSLILKI